VTSTVLENLCTPRLAATVSMLQLLRKHPWKTSVGLASSVIILDNIFILVWMIFYGRKNRRLLRHSLHY